MEQLGLDWIKLHWIVDNVEHLDCYDSSWLDAEDRLHKAYGASEPTYQAQVTSSLGQEPLVTVPG